MKIPAPTFRELLLSGLSVVALGAAGCVSVKTQHTIDPIHITMDVNLRLEQELEETFSGLDEQSLALANENMKESER